MAGVVAMPATVEKEAGARTAATAEKEAGVVAMPATAEEEAGARTAATVVMAAAARGTSWYLLIVAVSDQLRLKTQLRLKRLHKH